MISQMINGHQGQLMLVETNYSAFVILVDSTPLLSRKTVAEIDHLEQNLTLLAFEELEAQHHMGCL
tara:strand:- start:552 stop:749 length:198 start_codon:yes stop_codon:yes gene_type:complete